MRLGKMVRGAMCLFALLALCGALPLGVAAADPAPKPDLRYVITRLGDQPAVLPPSGPATTGNTVQSFAFSGQGRITVAGEPGALGLALTGDFAQPDRVHMTLTLSDPSSGETIPIEV